MIFLMSHSKYGKWGLLLLCIGNMVRLREAIVLPSVTQMCFMLAPCDAKACRYSLFPMVALRSSSIFLESHDSLT